MDYSYGSEMQALYRTDEMVIAKITIPIMELIIEKGDVIMGKGVNKRLTVREVLACRVLSYMKHNGRDEFTKCMFNEYLLTIAKKLLKGRDPVNFICSLLNISLDDPVFKNLR